MLSTFEISILDAIASMRTAFWDGFFSCVTHLGDAGLAWIALGCALCVKRKYRAAGVAVLAALLADVLLCNALIKPLVRRIRPYEINTAVQLLIARPSDYSFPSGHTAASFAAASALLFAGKRRLAVGAFVLAVVIAFSRLYLYVHFPTDVLAGAALGTLCGFVGAKAATRAFSSLRS